MKFKKEARYLKNNSLTPQEKTAKIQTDQIHMTFGSITRAFQLKGTLEKISCLQAEQTLLYGVNPPPISILLVDQLAPSNHAGDLKCDPDKK